MYAITPAALANALTSPFAKLWRGEYSLPKAFWAFFIFGTVVAPVIAMIVAIPFQLAGMPQAAPPLFFIAMIVYPVFAAVGVWRSANARPFQRWPVAAAAAKIGVSIWLLGIAGRVTGLRLIDVARLTGFIHD